MKINMENTALIVIDMQNGFCHTDGSIANMGLDISMCEEAIPQVNDVIEFCRNKRAPIIFTKYVYRDDYRDGGILVKEILPGLQQSNALAESSWDSKIIDEIKVHPEDFLVTKNRYSSFYNTNLETILTSLKIENIILVGVTTNMCVEATARDASQKDYRVYVVSDAVGELDRKRHEVSLDTIGFGYGYVISKERLKNNLKGE